jgi:hypothetical protein
MSRGLLAFVCLSVAMLAAVRGAEPEKPKLRPYDGSQGYWLFPGSLSPDGAYALACGTAGLKREELGKLAPWPADLELDPPKMSFEDFLIDMKQRRVVGVLPDFDEFEWHDWHKNRGGLFVAWTPDCRHGLAICEDRWEDSGIVWMDAAAGKFTSVKEPLEKAYAALLRAHEKKAPIGSMLFLNPAAPSPDVVVMDAYSEIPKEESTERFYRLKVRFTPGKDGTMQCQILAGHKQKDATDPAGLDDVDFNDKLYKKLRAKLPARARAALDKEQDAWVTWSDAQSDDAQSMLILQRSALLRARAEFP